MPSDVIPIGPANLALLAVALSVVPDVVVPADGPAKVVTLPLRIISSPMMDPPSSVCLADTPAVRTFASEESVPVPEE